MVDTITHSIVQAGQADRTDTIYLTKFRKLIAPAPTAVLFPKQGSGVRNPRDFGTALAKTVRESTGLYLTPHGFRHFAAFVFLTQHPGEYVTVPKILGHKKLDTTIGFNAPLTSAAVIERYGDLLEMRWSGN